MQTANDIRAAFLAFFAGQGHEVVTSSPLVPHNDPSLLFTNAGMVQFKNVFTGTEKRSYQRAATSQKCVRAGGKHNDLDNVGYTARHHTFFEMLGNFSFGDYFKADAIEFAWSLVTSEYGLPAKRLLVTVFHEDDEAFDLWRKVAGLPENKIIRIPTKDNFWSMGDTGPCGPCSEIFYDHGEEIPGGPPGSADAEGDRFVEIWNLVFMQFEQVTPDERIDLPKPSIDTGMGLERITAVIQGVHDNYDTDSLRHLIDASAEASGVTYADDHRIGHRVVADHLRAASFLLADGVMPANEGRGYVLRRIMRRAMRHAHMMGCEEPLMWRLVPALVEQMGQAYPELRRAEALISEILKLEEGRFKRTLGRGLKLLDEATENLPKGADLPGRVAFKLYDTYGFPLDLTEDVLRGQGRSVERAGFDAAMAKQRADARNAWVGSGDESTEKLWFALRDDAGATEFLGYGVDVAEARVLALVSDGAAVDRANPGADIAVIVNQTPFYGESGGQMGDSGVITAGHGGRVEVRDTQKLFGDFHVHHGNVVGAVRLGDVVEMRIDSRRRSHLRGNHSATHLLHQALRRQLGDHVVQKGSLVAPDRLRFDFSHTHALSSAQLEVIEIEVNGLIRQNSSVATTLMSPQSAVERGALALFGEKYGDEVRVVTMGVGDTGDKKPYSVELCGGTHVRRTGDIGLFKIVSESAVAVGVRRVEALTGELAECHVRDQERRLSLVAATLKSSPADLPERVAALVEDRKRLERELAAARRASTGQADTVRDVDGVKFAAQALDGVPPKELRSLADEMKNRLESGVVALVTVNDGKAALVVGVTSDLTERFDAVELARAGAAALGGAGGGGRPDMAQAGGPNGDQAEVALSKIARALQTRT